MEMNNIVEFWDSLGYDRYVLVLLAIFFCVHLTLLICRSRVLLRSKKQSDEVHTDGVSVILTCSNSAELLQNNLEAFLLQDYPCFEVIVVDECSEDDTQEVLLELQNKYPHLRTSRIFPGTKFRRTKKIAINIGVLAAKYDVLLFSEINCVPESKKWIRIMQSYFDEKTAAVIGYSNYVAGKRAIDIRRYFRFMWLWKTAVLINRGIYLVGNGYNMGYRKKYYLEKRGFTGNTQEYIGYDTDIVQGVSKKGEVKIVNDGESMMIIEDLSSKIWKDDCSYYYATKRRWTFGITLLGNMDFIVECLFYVCSIYMVILSSLGEYFLIPIVLVFLINLIVINICLKKLMVKKLGLSSLLVGSIGFMYKFCYGVSSIFTSKKWK